MNNSKKKDLVTAVPELLVSLRKDKAVTGEGKWTVEEGSRLEPLVLYPEPVQQPQHRWLARPGRRRQRGGALKPGRRIAG